MDLMSFRSRSRVKASVVLTRVDYLCTFYIKSLLNIILRPILVVRIWFVPAPYCLCVLRLSQLSHPGCFNNKSIN